MCDELIQCGKDGMGRAEMAAHLGINRATLEAWSKEKPEFSSALKTALDFSQAWWERKGREGAIGSIPNFNATGYIFQMKNRFRSEWNDTVKSEHSGPDGQTLPNAITLQIVKPNNGGKPDA